MILKPPHYVNNHRFVPEQQRFIVAAINEELAQKWIALNGVESELYWIVTDANQLWGIDGNRCIVVLTSADDRDMTMIAKFAERARAGNFKWSYSIVEPMSKSEMGPKLGGTGDGA